MAKINIEICMISARGLSRSKSLFLKPQWFAVGWINPRKKYCSKVDNSGSSTATWKTKFSASFDETSYSLQGWSFSFPAQPHQSSPYANYQSRHPDASEPPAAYPVKHPYTSPAGISGYHRPRTPPPPPPPSNTGFLLALFPGREDVPPSGRNSEPSFAMDLGASALAAGAVIFGDDFMSS